MTREEREKLREKAKEYVGSYMETHLIEAKDTLALLDHCDTLEARCEKLEQALKFIADKKVSSPCVIEILQAYEERASQALAQGKGDV